MIGSPVAASTTRPLIDPPTGRSTSAVEPDEATRSVPAVAKE